MADVDNKVNFILNTLTEDRRGHGTGDTAGPYICVRPGGIR